eukprot:CAMPEP_0118947294 /NCGR_PEP_ID=MMETSP1169-20130426/45750_1 /TAXON_ID=36882 /ORGANISM="Pyramimonas obovata, Strain CCMP722" /LENGTH=239 /DNA_ID=CAMNT_0006893479 /DNA_START=127 /DNA_END=847 /DNA_ORIENTATION=+
MTPTPMTKRGVVAARLVIEPDRSPSSVPAAPGGGTRRRWARASSAAARTARGSARRRRRSLAEADARRRQVEGVRLALPGAREGVQVPVLALHARRHALLPRIPPALSSKLFEPLPLFDWIVCSPERVEVATYNVWAILFELRYCLLNLLHSHVLLGVFEVSDTNCECLVPCTPLTCELGYEEVTGLRMCGLRDYYGLVVLDVQLGQKRVPISVCCFRKNNLVLHGSCNLVRKIFIGQL